MIIGTSAGVYEAHTLDGDADTITVGMLDLESAQILVDGLEMVCGALAIIENRPDEPVRKFSVQVSRENFAQWVAFEIREYL